MPMVSGHQWMDRDTLFHKAIIDPAIHLIFSGSFIHFHQREESQMGRRPSDSIFMNTVFELSSVQFNTLKIC